MSDALYSKEFKCPVCNNKFQTLRAKTNACIVTKKDEDFCTHYKDLNPMFYEIIVCPVCAYAASENNYSELTKNEVQILQEAFCGREVKRTFCYKREVTDGLDTFKLALFTANLKKSKNSIIAGICLKIAWMYRYMEDSRETVFLGYALDNYKEAFNRENLPIGGLDQISMLYILGELSRRLGNFDDAILWFSKAVSSPERRSNPRIERLARDQWALAKEQYKEKQKAEAL